MISKIKYFLIAVLTIGLVGGAMNVSAQYGTGNGDGTLVSAGGEKLRQSDINEIISFYEWAFQTKFNSNQRERFQEIKEDEFRNDPAGSRKGNDDLINVYYQVKTKSQSEQAELRRKFNASFIPDLRKATDDTQARFLVRLYDGANGGENSSDDNAANNDSDNDDSNSVGDLSSFTGKWVWQNSGIGEWDKGSGAYLGGSGTQTTYEFASNGSVIYTGIMNVMMGGCSQQTFLKQTGRASISGNTMTIRWSPGTSTRDFSCDKGGNYTKTAPAVNETFPVSFKTNSTGQRLFCMNPGTSKETCFSPSR